jgi:hypothetical protein
MPQVTIISIIVVAITITVLTKMVINHKERMKK